MNRYHFFLIFFFFTSLCTAQEVLRPLKENAVLKSFPKQVNKGISKRVLPDTLKLPFMDDFSGKGPYPDSKLWIDSNVYINNTYPYSPPSKGVATFDALDKTGTAYPAGALRGWADSLTSRPINLYNYTDPSSGNLANYGPSDSVFLSFYYQPKGRGNAPEIEDSLILQFKTPGKDWISITHVSSDTLDTLFRKVTVLIRDTSWFKKGFQFRFVNYASYGGSIDHWHLDYVYMDRKASQNSFLNDVAIVSISGNMLNNYSSMPWSHYVPSRDKGSSLSLKVRNFAKSGSQPNLTFVEYGIFSPVKNTQNATLQINAGSRDTSTVFSFPFDFTASGPTDVLNFETGVNINPSPDANLRNDTIRFTQHFGSYFAYDDGTAENGYGVNTINGKIALKFTLNQTDSLRAVGIFFDQILESMEGRAFTLKVWESLNPEKEIYSSPLNGVLYEKGMNNFHIYYLPSPVSIPSTVYIGLQQYTTDILNIGFDENSDHHSLLFYDTGSGWSGSAFNGTLMIRPYVGKMIPDGIHEIGSGENISIFPNPGKDRFYLKGAVSDLPFEIFDQSGRLVYSGRTSGMHFEADLEGGFYLVRLHSESGHFTRKLVVTSHD